VKAASPLDGILLIDKEQGWTSHDVVAKVRRITGQRKSGHTGTLDPMATGLVVVCLGQATRLVEYMTAHDKRYIGEVRLGQSTDTDDAEGQVVAEAPVPLVGDEQLRAIERRFTGELLQLPPAYSALKVDGQRAYAVARAGGVPDLKARPVSIHAIALRQTAADRLGIEVHCGPGTYIRSLARDIGALIGCGAHLSALRRASVGTFRVAQAFTLSELEAIVTQGELIDAVLPLDDGILDVPVAIVGEERSALLRHGQVLEPVVSFSEAPVGRVYDVAGGFVAIASVSEDGLIKPLKVFAVR